MAGNNEEEGTTTYNEGSGKYGDRTQFTQRELDTAKKHGMDLRAEREKTTPMSNETQKWARERMSGEGKVETGQGGKGAERE